MTTLEERRHRADIIQVFQDSEWKGRREQRKLVQSGHGESDENEAGDRTNEPVEARDKAGDEEKFLLHQSRRR